MKSAMTLHTTKGELLKSNERSFLNTLLGFTITEYAIGSEEREKLVKISGIDKNLIECHCINGSNVNGFRQPIFMVWHYINFLVKRQIKNLELNSKL